MALPRADVLVPVIAACCACVSTYEVKFPSDPQAVDLLIILDHPGAELEVLAVPATGGFAMTLTAGPAEDTLTVLSFHAPLARWQIEHGPVRASTREDARPLPRSDRAWSRTVMNGAFGEWEELTDVSDRIAAYRIEPIDPRRCAELGACLNPGEEIQCLLPCPAFDEAIDPLPPALPNAVVPPIFDCPPSWSARFEDGARSCVPPAAAGVMACPKGQGQLIDTPGCVQIGQPCPPAGIWRTDVRGAGRVYHVSSGAIGGDGSDTLPFGTIAEATALAVDGDVILLDRGSYETAVELREGVHLAGACAAETEIIAPPANSAILVSGARARAGDLSVRSDAYGVSVAAGASVELEGVIAEGGLYGVIAAERGAISARELVVRGCSLSGVVVAAGSRLELERSTIERCANTGVVVERSSSASISQVLIRDLESGPQFTWGMLIAHRASAAISEVMIERLAGTGIFVAHSSSATIGDALIRDLAPDPDGETGMMVLTSTVMLRRAQIERVAGTGLEFHGSRAVIEDLLVRDVVRRSSEGRAAGHGVLASWLSHVELAQALVTRTENCGVYAIDRSFVRAEDLIVRDARHVDGFPAGQGIRLVGARGEVERLLVERVPGGAIQAVEASVLSAFDVIAREHDRGAPGSVPRTGVYAGASRIELDRALIEGAYGGVSIADFAHANIHDLTVRDPFLGAGVPPSLTAAGGGAWVLVERAELEGRVEGVVSDPVLVLNQAHIRGLGGTGLQARISATATITEVLIEDASPGIHVDNRARVRATRFEIRDGRTGAGSGAAIDLDDRGRVWAEKFRLLRHPIGIELAGELAGGRPVLLISEGEIAENQVGVSVLFDQFNFGSLLDRVRFRDNGVNFREPR